MAHPIAGIISGGMPLSEGFNILDSRCQDAWSKGSCNDPLSPYEKDKYSQFLKPTTNLEAIRNDY